MKIKDVGEVGLPWMIGSVVYGLFLMLRVNHFISLSYIWLALPPILVICWAIVERILAKKKGQLFESQWQVQMESGNIISVDYEKNLKSVRLEDLCRVTVETNDSGPWGTDVWWILEDNRGKIAIPGGATGEPELVRHLQSLRGFKDEELIKAMGCTRNATFVLYQNGK